VTVVVICALEDEAEALGHEANLGGFTPAEQVERDLSQAVILGHVVHGLTPPLERGVKRPVWTYLGLLDRLEPFDTWVLDLSYSVIKVELCGEIPFAIVCVWAADIVCMESEESLVGGHA